MTLPEMQAVEPSSVRMNSRKLAEVCDLFRQQNERGAFLGGQLFIKRYGSIVVNMNIGQSRPFIQSPVQQTTPFSVYSAGKPIVAIAIALLEDRGQLDISAPIAELLPEFAVQGKQDITTLDILTHTAGILIPSSYSLEPEKRLVWQTIVETKPVYPRGTFAYMPVEYGVILSEIILRLTGKNLADFMIEELAIPLNLPMLRYGLAGREVNTVAYTYWLGNKQIKLYGSLIAENIEQSLNSPTFYSSSNPAFSMITNANSLASFYEFLLNKGTTPSGKQIISEKTISQYTNRAIAGWNKTLHMPLAMGRGFTLGGILPSAYGWWRTQSCFGHGGLFSCIAYGDYTTQLAVAIVTNANRSAYDFYKRFIPLTHGIRKACW